MCDLQPCWPALHAPCSGCCSSFFRFRPVPRHPRQLHPRQRCPGPWSVRPTRIVASIGSSPAPRSSVARRPALVPATGSAFRQRACLRLHRPAGRSRLAHPVAQRFHQRQARWWKAHGRPAEITAAWCSRRQPGSNRAGRCPSFTPRAHPLARTRRRVVKTGLARAASTDGGLGAAVLGPATHRGEGVLGRRRPLRSN
jgi:hypothetical protein